MILENVIIATLDKPSDVNGKIYSTELGEKIVADIKTIILGCVRDKKDLNNLDFLKISHMTTRLWIEDGKLMATIQILSTPAGSILKTILEADGPVPDFRMFGMGVVNPDQTIRNFKLYSIDAHFSV